MTDIAAQGSPEKPRLLDRGEYPAHIAHMCARFLAESLACYSDVTAIDRDAQGVTFYTTTYQTAFRVDVAVSDPGREGEAAK